MPVDHYIHLKTVSSLISSTLQSFFFCLSVSLSLLRIWLQIPRYLSDLSSECWSTPCLLNVEVFLDSFTCDLIQYHDFKYFLCSIELPSFYLWLGLLFCRSYWAKQLPTSACRWLIVNASMTSLKLSYLYIPPTKTLLSPVLPISVSGLSIVPGFHVKSLEIVLYSSFFHTQ